MASGQPALLCTITQQCLLYGSTPQQDIQARRSCVLYWSGIIRINTVILLALSWLLCRLAEGVDLHHAQQAMHKLQHVPGYAEKCHAACKLLLRRLFEVMRCCVCSRHHVWALAAGGAARDSQQALSIALSAGCCM